MYEGGYKKFASSVIRKKNPNLLKFQMMFVYTTQGSLVFALACSEASAFEWVHMTVQHGDPLGRTGLAGQSELWPKCFVAMGSVGVLLSRGAILLRDGFRLHTKQQARKLATDFSVRERLGYPSFIPAQQRAISISFAPWTNSCQDIVAPATKMSKPAAITSLTQQRLPLCESGTDKHTTPSKENFNPQVECVEI